MQPLRSWIPALALLGPLVLAGMLAGCRSSTESGVSAVNQLVREGRFAEAAEEARRQVEANPDNTALQNSDRDARIALYMDNGRQAVFAGRAERALEFFYTAEELDPTNEVLQDWIQKTRLHLAEHALDRAFDLTGPDQLDEAEAAFELALEYTPDLETTTKDLERLQRIEEQSQAGLARVQLLKDHRADQSTAYFEHGVRTYREYFLRQARWNFDVSFVYDRENERAKARGKAVEGMLAEERLAQARGLEEEGLYHAARNEYRFVLLIDPDNTEAAEGIARMDVETHASRKLTEAEMFLLRGEVEKAHEILAETQGLTIDQLDRVGLIESRIQESRLRALYKRARTFQQDYLYDEAIAAYEELLELEPYYEDVLSRKTTLEEFKTQVEDFYARALAAETDEEAADLLRRVPILWPEYRDAAERLAAIERRMSGDDTGGEDVSGESGSE